jgi:hypothetical protein
MFLILATLVGVHSPAFIWISPLHSPDEQLPMCYLPSVYLYFLFWWKASANLLLILNWPLVCILTEFQMFFIHSSYRSWLGTCFGSEFSQSEILFILLSMTFVEKSFLIFMKFSYWILSESCEIFKKFCQDYGQLKFFPLMFPAKLIKF